jgi:hypothetical protein
MRQRKKRFAAAKNFFTGRGATGFLAVDNSARGAQNGVIFAGIGIFHGRRPGANP